MTCSQSEILPCTSSALTFPLNLCLGRGGPTCKSSRDPAWAGGAASREEAPPGLQRPPAGWAVLAEPPAAPHFVPGTPGAVLKEAV